MLGMHYTGQHDAGWPPPEDGIDQRVLMGLVVAALSDQQLIASRGELRGQRLDRFLENTPRHGRDQRDIGAVIHEPSSTTRQISK